LYASRRPEQHRGVRVGGSSSRAFDDCICEPHDGDDMVEQGENYGDMVLLGLLWQSSLSSLHRRAKDMTRFE
jgi:hypothetical protein